MSFSLVIGRRAQRHIIEAYEFYDDRQPGLGDQFKASLNECFARILEHPRMYRFVRVGIRKARTEKFPYSVYYECMDEVLYVHLVLHDKQDSRSWLKNI